MGNGLKRILTISNALSFYRLLAAPVAVWTAVDGQRNLFFILVCVSLFTDLIDGFIARRLHQETTLGARLDALADGLTLVAVVTGVFAFEYESLEGDIFWLYLFLAVLALGVGISLIRFGKLPAFHLYSFKATDFLLTGFFLVLFTYGFVQWLFIFAMVFSTLASLEIVLVALVLDEFRTNQRGLYWVLKARS